MFIARSNAMLFAASFGRGPRTILAHGGWVGSGELWLPPFEILSRGWRTVTYDHRGTGASEAASISFGEMVEDVFAVLDAMGVARCVLAAESAGAPIVMEACRRAPERFGAMVLVAPRYDTRPDPQTTALRAGCAADFEATMDAFVDACLPDGAAIHRRWGRQIVKRATADTAVRLLASMADGDAAHHAAEIVVPTLILHGRKDAVVPLASSEALAGHIAGACLEVHDTAGHVPTVTEPEWVAERIEAFAAHVWPEDSQPGVPA